MEDYGKVYLEAAEFQDKYEAVSRMRIGSCVVLGDILEDQGEDRLYHPARLLYEKIFGFNKQFVADLTNKERVLFLCMAAACWKDMLPLMEGK